MRELKGDWRDLFNGFMLALDLRKMFLALCGVVASFIFIGLPIIYLGQKLDPNYGVLPTSFTLHELIKSIGRGLHVIYVGTHTTQPIFISTLLFTAVTIVIFVVIWAFFGGAIARIAAYEIAKDERIETVRALKFAKTKLSAFFWAPFICLIGFAIFYICVVLGGGLGWILDHLRIGGPIVAIFLPLALLAGFIMVLILLGTIFSITLFYPAVAAEGTDSFDAVSRGFSYLFSRAWHWIWYQLVNVGYGYVCIAFVILFAGAMCVLTLKAGATLYPQFRDINDLAWSTLLSHRHKDIMYKAYRWGPLDLIRSAHPYGRYMSIMNELADPSYNWNGFTKVVQKEVPGGVVTEQVELRGDRKVAAVITIAWLLIALGLAFSYIISYFFSQQTMIYFLLRKKVDGIEMKEIFEEPEEEEIAAPPTPVTEPAPPPMVEKKEEEAKPEQQTG
jgi:hypothetical protein